MNKTDGAKNICVRKKFGNSTDKWMVYGHKVRGTLAFFA